MRTWLRDETSRINEIVNKHAKLQAVGALSGEPVAPTVSKSNSASYDLLKAKTRESGSITRIEEFGFSSLSKDDAMNSSPEKEVAVSTGETQVKNKNGLRKSIATSETVLNEKSETIVAPVSFSMDKLCSDTTENDERGNVVSGETEGRDHARKAGLIKRRMLGSIRGLMASTHLLHSSSAHEIEEVHCSILFKRVVLFVFYLVLSTAKVDLLRLFLPSFDLNTYVCMYVPEYFCSCEII